MAASGASGGASAVERTFWVKLGDDLRFVKLRSSAADVDDLIREIAKELDVTARLGTITAHVARDREGRDLGAALESTDSVKDALPEADKIRIVIKVAAPATGVSTVPVAVAAGGGASAGEPLTFERLLINGGLPAAFIEAAAAQRARINYGHVVTLALLERNPAVALGAYEMAKRLPSTATVKVLHSKGYKLGGLLCQGSELVVCYKRLRVYLLKSLREDEAARVRIFHDAFAGTPVPHVTPYELVDTPGGKHFMIMPKFATALEPVSYLDPAGVAAIWAHMEEALGCLHAKGFAHADVKPANICVREDGLSFFLIDLGSVAQLGARTSSTLACVPRNIARGRASAELDWWMLAVTLAEKACGADHVLEVGRGHRASTAELRAHLAAHLSAAVWAALEPKLVG